MEETGHSGHDGRRVSGLGICVIGAQSQNTRRSARLQPSLPACRDLAFHDCRLTRRLVQEHANDKRMMETITRPQPPRSDGQPVVAWLGATVIASGDTSLRRSRQVVRNWREGDGRFCWPNVVQLVGTVSRSVCHCRRGPRTRALVCDTKSEK